MRKQQIKGLLETMKLEKPVPPFKPSKPREPEEFFWTNKMVRIDDLEIDIFIDHGYGDYDASVDGCSLTENDLDKINKALANLKNTSKSIKNITIDLYSKAIFYDQKVLDPNFEQKKKKYQQKLVKYEQNIKNFKEGMEVFKESLDKYNKTALTFELEQTRKRLAELEKKAENK